MKHKKLLLVYICAFLLFLYFHLFRIPIYVGDTDIWYHMNSGRYILQNLEIPKNSYFSFVTPPREWVDYYWLFQIIAYMTYEVGGYKALIIVRSTLFILITLFIFLIFFEEKRQDDEYPFLAIYFLFLSVFIFQRYTLFRPHTFSYLFLTIFLYVLEKKKKYVRYLPLLGIAWSNIHGIAYPVIVFVAFSYLVDFMVEKRKKGQVVQKEDLPYVLPLLVCGVTPFLTPHFSRLLVVPFIPIAFAKHYIQELSPFSIYDFTSIRIENFLISRETFVVFLLFFSLLSLICAIIKRILTLRHLLLFLAGLILLSKGKRFAYEFFLLTLPLVSFSPCSIYLREIKKDPSRVLVFAFFFVFLFLPLLHLISSLRPYPRYPFSFNNLPYGITNFLSTEATGGNILNHPNYGGYLQWMLYPKYKIFMDMEVPFLFTNEDMFLALRIFNIFDEKAFSEILEKYDPSFVVGSISTPGFKFLMKKFPFYKIVFFDDFFILYANCKHYPKLVSKFEIKNLDPYELKNLPVLGKKAEDIKKEFDKIYNFHPECAIANEYLALFLKKRGKLNEALIHAENIIKAYPEYELGYAIKADILREMNDLKGAASYLKKAIKIRETKENVFALGKIYFEMGDYKKAYELMVRAINVFLPHTNHRDIYYVVKSAILSGKKKDASVLFKYGIMMLPKEDEEYVKKYMEILPSLMDYLEENMQPYDSHRQKGMGSR